MLTGSETGTSPVRSAGRADFFPVPEKFVGSPGAGCDAALVPDESGEGFQREGEPDEDDFLSGVELRSRMHNITCVIGSFAWNQ
jgi:hypothetical protein